MVGKMKVPQRMVMQFQAWHQQEWQKVKANVIDHVLVLHSNDHKAKTRKMGQVQQKETSWKAPAHQVNQMNLRVSAIWMANARTRHAIIGIRPKVSSTRRMKVAKFGERVRFFIQAMKRQARSRKRTRNLEERLVQTVRSDQNFGCVWIATTHTVGLADVRRFILKKNGKTSPRTHVELKYTKTAEIFINIREQLGPSLGEIQGLTQTASQSQRIENRGPNNTLCGADDARKAAWQWAKKLYKNRGTHLENEGIFFKPKLECAVASTSTVNPDDMEWIYCWYSCIYVNEEQDEFIT